MQSLVPLTLLLLLLAPALAERWSFYRTNTTEMAASDLAIKNDTDAAQIISALRTAGPGRVYAGTRFNWGMWMKMGNLRFYDLLPIEQFDTLMPWQSLSLNSPYLWRLNTPNPMLSHLYNIRYVIAPRMIRPPKTYHPIVTTARYTLYQNDSYSYLELGQIVRVLPWKSDSDIYQSNHSWLSSQEPSSAQFNAFFPPGKTSDPELEADVSTGSAGNPEPPGQIQDEIITPDSIRARIVASSRALLVFKTTYHPNWHVLVDGREQRAFMVSPSFLATEIDAGSHEVRAEYRSSTLKKVLILIALLTLAVTALSGKWFGSAS